MFFDTYTCKGHIMGESMEYDCIYWMLGNVWDNLTSGPTVAVTCPLVHLRLLAIFDPYITLSAYLKESIKAMAHL